MSKFINSSQEKKISPAREIGYFVNLSQNERVRNLSIGNEEKSQIYQSVKGKNNEFFQLQNEGR